MAKIPKVEIIKNNIKHLLKEKNENQVSLSDGAGVNRTTIYNILEGKVSSIQEKTLKKVSDFFGVSYSEIQEIDFCKRDMENTLMSIDGNMNPIAVPLINESLITSSLNKKIGRMILGSPITYYFGDGPNIIGVILSSNIGNYYSSGDILIVKRKEIIKDSLLLIFSSDKNLDVINSGVDINDKDILIGSILEERYDS
ncbi:helix-turn-helix transcriptional regulator (plasmid) [Arsenophonus sp. aPb]|uniref:helix-turn-helix transcriptional regulator n=1 Tax=Arsenophonus sp. aPb TaxID=3041619 RepID=UPI00246926CC|nr:helix-turn-helix transcriptional regulator [Arsenophonus sp. aPb]WGL99857.1 helix-turn-helix transcriptional regulator [Arsenophonus sp. aPb]